jgi:carboxyl-terminal processing protease
MLSRGRLLFVASSLIVVLLVAGGRMLAESERQVDDGKDSLYKYMAVFTEVLNLVDRAYVEERDEASLMAGAFEGVLDALDPFALYVPAAEIDRYRQVREIGTTRSGLLVLKERGVAFAAAVEEGSPAAEAGIERGHILAAINGERTRPMPLFEIRALLAGPPGTEIEVERIHQGRKEDVRFTLADYRRPGVGVSVRRGVPVVRLPAFLDTTPEDLETSLRTVMEGAPELAGLTERDRLVLDLRGVAGGDEAVAYRVAGLFTRGELGRLEARDEEIVTFADTTEPLWQGRMAVVIDPGTQGAAEIVTTVLRQNVEATLVGNRSFGHAGRLGEVELQSGDRLLLTDAFYTGPDGEPIDHSLDPDLWVRPSFTAAEAEDADAEGADAGAEEVEPEPDEVLDRAVAVVLGEEELEEEDAAAA